MRITTNHQHLSLLLLLLLATAHSQSNTIYSFPSFDSNGNSSVVVLKDSNINLAAVQLTPDTINYLEYFALILGAVVAAAAVILGLFYIRRRRDGDNPRGLMDAINSLPGMPREFKFNTLKKATNNFDQKLKLGEGGFGEVYKGLLPGQNVTVAVKKFFRDKSNGQDDFLAELTIINRLRHKILVPLIGWCHNDGVMLLVYEYMPNGDMGQHVFCGPSPQLLSWTAITTSSPASHLPSITSTMN